MQVIRVGIIGLGEVAQIIHLPILQALDDRYQVTAICDISPTLLAAMGDRYHIPESARHADFRDLVARDDVDLVFVLNSNEYHAECAIAACEAGKHVLIEKPIALTMVDAEAIAAARDAAGVQVMVGYMRRFAPAFVEAVDEVRKLDRIRYVRVRDIIGHNRLFIAQSSNVIYPTDFPEEAIVDRKIRNSAMLDSAIGPDASPTLRRAYGLLAGLSSHDLSAMRELLGRAPERVISAEAWDGGGFLTVLMDYGDFGAYLETGSDGQRRFDAHLEVLGTSRSVKVQYDSPYIRHLPTTLELSFEDGERHIETVIRPTYKDPYTHELEELYEVVTGSAVPKTSVEDSLEDLHLFQQIIAAMRESPRA